MPGAPTAAKSITGSEEPFAHVMQRWRSQRGIEGGEGGGKTAFPGMRRQLAVGGMRGWEH